MDLRPTDIDGAFTIDLAPHRDDRGFFARAYDEAVFQAAGLPTRWPQWNVSWNDRRGTLRGLHYQAAPAPEPKLVRCTRGSVFDVAVDLRPASPTFCRWFGVDLSAARRNALYIPPGCAHGFLTLEDGCELFYHMGDTYEAALSRGVRWNDPSFGILWPFEPITMSERDATLPDFVPLSL